MFQIRISLKALKIDIKKQLLFLIRSHFLGKEPVFLEGRIRIRTIITRVRNSVGEVT